MAGGGSNNRNTETLPGEVISWVIIVACFATGWGVPIGIILLIRKFRKYIRGANRTDNADNEVRAYIPSRASAIGYAPTARKRKSAYRHISAAGVSVPLLLLALILFLIGGSLIYECVRDMTVSAVPFAGALMWKLLRGVFCFAGGASALTMRGFWKRRITRYNGYLAVVGQQGIVPVREVAAAMGTTTERARHDLEKMIADKYFGKSAYIDRELDSIVLSPAAAKKVRQGQDAAQGAPAQGDSEYLRILRELRELNDKIEDEPISDKIDHIENVTAKIFTAVEENPSKLPQIRRFMNYYLPTTLKLLRTYATLERQGVGGENIAEARGNIDRILGTLAQGFEQQHDQLFESDAIDISSDINVLENMMRQDGLTGEGLTMRTLEGGET